ncbi:hypothetical protein [Nocardia macrotermitis]|uniref:Uncharacterized protein n=1 Tax=Nocardia macrotermitis TaxID=2585198 RepID=A0A7K0CUJ5_9NOCA|nr:hypothetical protein [Nocardia macrotermitis]MQY17053.1 hypothetical protein [Nocardia macrotermitis]
MSTESTTAATPPEPELQPGTTAPFARMHRWLQRGILVCLVALVIEGSLTVPALALWYGWPTLSLTQICDEMMKVRYSDDTLTCKQGAIDAPPLGGRPEAAGQRTARDQWGVQPKPEWQHIGFRQLVKIHNDRIAREKSQQQAHR